MTKYFKRERVDEKSFWYYKDIPVNVIEIPDNATNGDMIKAMFPQLEIRILPDMVIVFGEDYAFQHHYPIDWWNAPYKRGETNE